MDLTVVIEGPGQQPIYATAGAAGADLFAFIEEPVTLLPGERVSVATGLKLAIPDGCEGQVRPRSGLAFKQGIMAFPGTIDADFRGELQVLLFHLGPSPYVVMPGERIAQIVFSQAQKAHFRRSTVSETERGDGGFGHTGR